MALQIWLPLDGNLKNYGLLGWQPTLDNGTTATYVNGKIGKALNTGGITMPAEITSQVLNNNTFSYACWFCATGATGSTSERAMIFGNNSMSTLGGRQFSLFQYSTANNLHWSWQNQNNGTYSSAYGGVLENVFPTNVWVHLAVVYNNPSVKIYINGQEKYSGSWISKTDSFNYNTTLIWNSSYHYLNDVRIYNHALSFKEVSELAKGLFLHYKLSKPLPNLLSKYVSPGQANPGVTTTAGRTNYLEDYGIQIPATDNADTYFRLFLIKQLIQNNKYTFSCVVSGLKKGSYYSFPFFAQNNTAMGVIKLDHNGLNSYTFTMNSSAQNAVTDPEGKTVYIMFMDDSGRSIASGQQPFQITQMKLEEGDKVTGWIPNETDALYSAMGYNSNIELDCAPAGNTYDGTIVGTITAAADSPKYETSYYFDGTSAINTSNPFGSNDLIKNFSISLWIKRNPLDGKTHHFYCGNMDLYLYTNDKLRIQWNHAADDLSYNNTNTWDTGEIIPENQWTQIAFTFNAGIIDLYINGKYVKTSNRSGTGTNIRGYRGNCIGSYTNLSNPFIGNISDIRVYCTTLSAADIKELYNTAAQIDKDGNIYTYEYKEE